MPSFTEMERWEKDAIKSSFQPARKEKKRDVRKDTPTRVPEWRRAPTCTEQDDLVVQRELREVRDPLGPFHQGEELLVGCLADVCDGVVGLKEADLSDQR